MAKSVRQNRSRGNDRPGQCASTRFINSGDVEDTQRTQSFFVPESATARHLAATLRDFFVCANELCAQRDQRNLVNGNRAICGRNELKITHSQNHSYSRTVV